MRKLAKIRTEKGMVQKDVALKAGVSRAFYTQVETGVRVPSLPIAKSIADALGISLDTFFYALEVTYRDPKQELERGFNL